MCEFGCELAARAGLAGAGYRVVREFSSRRDAAAMSSTARWKAGALAREGGAVAADFADVLQGGGADVFVGRGGSVGGRA